MLRLFLGLFVISLVVGIATIPWMFITAVIIAILLTAYSVGDVLLGGKSY